jgi:hypothetical protein
VEAAVADKEAAMTEWNDGRLDDLSKRVDDGFTQMRKEMREEFTHVNARIDRMDDSLQYLGARFDALQRTLMQVSGVMVAALIGVIATQL